MTDDQALTRSLYNRLGHLLQRVDFENSLHLGEESIQETEVAARDSDDSRHSFWIQRLLWKTDAGRRPMPLQKLSDLCCGQGPKLMDKTDTRVELRVACETLFDALCGERKGLLRLA